MPVALGLLAAMAVLPAEEIAGDVALGELALDGALLRGRPRIHVAEALGYRRILLGADVVVSDD